MSNIAIKDLKVDTTLDQTAMNELRGGQRSQYLAEVIGESGPNGDNYSSAEINFPDMNPTGLAPEDPTNWLAGRPASPRRL